MARPWPSPTARGLSGSGRGAACWRGPEMATLDELLLDPTPEEVARLLGKARSTANRGLREGRVEKDADFWGTFARRMSRRPEGRQKWVGKKRGWREQRPEVSVA